MMEGVSGTVGARDEAIRIHFNAGKWKRIEFLGP
jgi:hypothetical protein